MATSDLARVAMLTDGRFPVGGHAHSAGFEAATTAFGLADEQGVERFLIGRLATTGVTDAHLLAAIRHRLDDGRLDWSEADVEIEARIASPTLRSTSRLLGRHWLRAAQAVFPGEQVERLRTASGGEPHQVAAVAAATAQADVTGPDAVRVHLHHLVSSVLGAAVRLHGLDPFRMAAMQRSVLPRCASIADAAQANAASDWRDLPAPAGPLTDILAEVHAAADGRMFRS